jgi:cytochrome c
MENDMTRPLLSVLAMTALLTPLYGCQPDAPAKQPAESAPAASALPAASQVTVAPVAVQQEPKTASADAKERELAQKSGCFACHMIDKKMVGPAWNAVAAKYRGQKDAEARLIAKVAKGGSGVWGVVPMPPNSPKVSDGDIKILVHFILSLN